MDEFTFRLAGTELVRTLVGRDPRPSEVDWLAQTGLQLHAEACASWARGAAFDVPARFVMAVEERYEAERDYLARVEDAQRSRELLNEGFESLREMIGDVQQVPLLDENLEPVR